MLSMAPFKAHFAAVDLILNTHHGRSLTNRAYYVIPPADLSN